MSKRKRNPRGFKYSEYKDSNSNVIRLQESSRCGGPYIWLFTNNATGAETYEHLGARHAVSPHLTRGQARRLGLALLRFAEGTY